MANIPLQSISFPGLSDKYTTPVVDNTLTQTGAAADAKKTGDEIGAIKNDLSEFPNGNYPQMGAGYANQLVSGLKKADQTPYNFRAVPYDATLEDVEKIVGGTIVNNQLVGTADTSVTVQNGHKAYKSINGTASVFTSDGTAVTVTGGTDIVIDLTQMLGTSIADYVLSLETATAGAGVAWLKTHFPKQFNVGYQPYDAGTLKSIEGLSGKKTVGFNQWDEVWEAGYYDANGLPVSNYTTIRSKNYIRVIPNTEYYYKVPNGTNYRICYFDANKNFIYRSDLFVQDTTFTTPSNCHFIMFHNDGTTYNHDICINLSDPTKNGTYEPYEAHSYALDSDVVLRGIPKVNEQGKLYYDGDEYLPDGTVNRRYDVVDMGTLGWVKGNRNNADTGNIFYCSFQSAKKASAVVCTKYTLANPYQATWENLSVNTMEIDTGNFVAVCSTEETVADFKTAVTGVPMLYELATSTTETADPYQTPQIISPDGTEEYIYEDSAFELSVGHSSEYPANISGQLDDILDTPSANGTYTLKATVTDGAVTYSWVADA